MLGIGTLVLCSLMAPIDSHGITVLSDVRLYGNVLYEGKYQLIVNLSNDGQQNNVEGWGIYEEIVINKSKCVKAD